MQTGINTLTVLLCLCLLPVKAKSEVALGVSFFGGARSASLLRVKDRSMIGADFELYFARRGDKRITDTSTGSPFGWLLSPAVMAMRIHRSGEFAPLSYIRLVVSASRPPDETEWIHSGEIGIGFIWRPPQKKEISLSARHGFIISYKDRNGTWTGKSNPPNLLVTFSF